MGKLARCGDLIMHNVTVKSLNKMLKEKGFKFHMVSHEVGEYRLKYGYGLGYGIIAMQFSSREILTVRDYIQDMIDKRQEGK